MTDRSIYTVGGTVPPDSKLYVPRRADEDLLTLCRSGIFAYILTSRQMGKSSLMVRTAKLLSEEGIRIVLIDLNEIGVDLTAEAWYFGLLTKIQDELDLKKDVFSWWQAHQHLGVANRLTLFFRNVLLNEISERVVIFVDEIDSTLGLDFTDDFYAAIRFLHNARSHEPKFERLSFVLIGVATPNELINNPKRTPFNVGQRINLTDFTLKEARPFADGFGLRRQQGLQVLAWALQWTGGHPYLTQRLSQLIAECEIEHWTKAEIDQIVQANFFGEMSWQDHNLQFVRDTLTKRTSDLARAMSLYRAIRTGLYPVYDDEEQIAATANLKLSGVVRAVKGVLHVRNSIYAAVFNEQWIDDVEAREEIADPNELARLRALAEAQERQLEAERRQVQEQQRRTEAERRQTKEQQRRTEAERRQAIEQARADEQAHAATKLRHRALWLSAALIVATIALVTAGLLGAAAQSNATTAQTAQAEEAIARATAQADSLRALNAEATALDDRATAQAEALRALDAEATAQAARGVAEGKSVEALDAEATARAEANLADIARAEAQNEATRSFEAEQTAEAGAIAEAVARATAQAGATAEAIAKATAQNAEGTARAEAFRADQARGDAQREADRARDAEREADDERATAERRGTLEAQARRTAEAAEGTAIARQETIIAQSTRAAEVEATAQANSKIINGANQLILQSSNLLDQQYDLALLLNLEANLISRNLTSNLSDYTISLLTALIYSPRLKTILYNHDAQVNSVTFSPDGQLLASGNEKGGIILSNAETGLQIGDRFSEQFGAVSSLAFNPNKQSGYSLASGGVDTTIVLWNIPDSGAPQPMVSLTDHVDSVTSVTFSSDGELLASGSSFDDGRIILWDITEEPPESLSVLLNDNFELVKSLAFSPNGDFLVAGLGGGQLILWDVSDPQEPDMIAKNTSIHIGTINSVAFSPDSEMIASAGADILIALWDTTDLPPKVDGQLEEEWQPKEFVFDIFDPGELGGHLAAINSITFGSNDDTLISSSDDGTVIIWDLRTNQPEFLRGHSGPVKNVAFNTNNNTIVSGGSDSRVMMWNVSPLPRFGTKFITDTETIATFNPQSQDFVATEQSNRLMLWNALTKQPVAPFSNNQDSEIRSIAFSPNGQLMASGDAQADITFWDVSQRTPVPLGDTPIKHNNPVTSLAFSPDNQTLASGGVDAEIILWDTTQRTSLLTETLSAHNGTVNSIAFSSDAPDSTGDRILASASNDDTVILWDVSSRDSPKFLTQLTNHDGDVTSVAFSPDGRILASGSSDKSIILWDFQGWNSQDGDEPQVRTTLKDQTAGITALAFSANSQILASGDTTGQIILWDIQTEQQLGALIGHSNRITSLSFSRDGQTLVSGSQDGLIIWDFRLEFIQDRVCGIINRNLTKEELDTFIDPELQRSDSACPNLPFPASPSITNFSVSVIPTATPSATATATPSPTVIPTTVPTPIPTATVTPTPSPTSQTATIIPSPSPSATITPTFTATVTPSTTLLSEPNPTPTPTPTVTLETP